MLFVLAAGQIPQTIHVPSAAIAGTGGVGKTVAIAAPVSMSTGNCPSPIVRVS